VIRRSIRYTVAAATVLTWTAAIGQTAGTSTTVKPVRQPPFYQGDRPDGRPAAHVPIVVTTPDDLPQSWLPLEALGRLAADMNAWLDAAGRTVAMPAIGGEGKATAPDVYLGCALDFAGECDPEQRENVLATTTGTRLWRSGIGAAVERVGVERVLVLQLGVAPQWIQQKNLKGSKEIRLGTDRAQHLPWLSSLDTPLWVLQVRGAVVDRDGKILRSGAEGIWAIRTSFRASVLELERLISDADVDFVRTGLRREDAADGPLVWQEALGQIVKQLIGDPQT